MKTLPLGAGVSALILSVSLAFAAPCNTQAARDASPNDTANMTSSDVDKSSRNEAGGAQPASPGTVGALNNVGASQAGGQQASSDKSKEDPGAKNMAGGRQPASPGTVGAMNNTGAAQKVGKDNDC